MQRINSLDAFAEEIPYLPERLDEMRDRVRNLRVTNRLTVAIPAENLDGSFPTPMSINTDNIWDCLVSALYWTFLEPALI